MSGAISRCWCSRRRRQTERQSAEIKTAGLSPPFYRTILSLVIEERAEFPTPARMLQLPERLRLDLPDALAGDRELLADFLERVVGVHADAEAHAQHALLARRQ